jgi:hypothetical protein
MVVSRFDTLERAVEEGELGVGFTEAALAESRGDHWPHNRSGPLRRWGRPALPGGREALCHYEGCRMGQDKRAASEEFPRSH